MRDLNDDGWLDGLPGNYDVVATVNALHWFDARRAGQLIKDVHGTLRGGGKQSCSQSPPLLSHPSWLDSKSGRPKQPPRYTPENWKRFWSRANVLLGYDHTTLLGPRHANRIGEDGMSVAGWEALAQRSRLRVH